MPVILIRADGHLSLANSAALEEAEAWGRRASNVIAEGRPTGIVRRGRQRAAPAMVPRGRSPSTSFASSSSQAAGVRRGARGDLRPRDGHSRLARDGARSRCSWSTACGFRWTWCVYVADTDIPWVIDLGLETHRRGPLAGRVDRRPDGVDVRSLRGRSSRGVAYEDDDEPGRVLPQRPPGRPPGGRATPSATRPSSRPSGSGSACTGRSTRGSDGTSGPAAIASSTSSCRHEQPDRARRGAGLAISVQPAFDAAVGSPGRAVRAATGDRSGLTG